MPPEKIRLPLRWQFKPIRNPRDGAIEWQWEAYDYGGQLKMRGEQPCATLTDCVADAKLHGFQEPRGA